MHQRIELKDQIKNGVICLVIIFTPLATVIKMSKMAYSLYFVLMTKKISHSLGSVHLKDLI